MISLTFLLAVLALKVTIQGQIFNDSTLKFVYVLARHGSRVPLASYPLDPYLLNDTRYWPDGPGQLTRAGKIQGYNVGVQLRRRYNDLLGPMYNVTETRISTNTVGRDMMSAQLLAAGLFPPVGEEIWNPNLLWQPVAIQTVMYDVIDVTNFGTCPKFVAIQDIAYEKAYTDLFLPRKEFISLLKNVTGIDFSDRNELKNIKYVYDALYIEKEEGFKLPAWATEDFLSNLTDLTWRQYRLHIAGLPEMVRLSAGPVLKGIITDFESRSRGKMTVLMSHDNTIFTVAQAMGFSDFEMPDMAAYLILEVHGRTNGDNTSDIVQVLYYKNGFATVPELLDMPVCRHPCPFEQFIALAENFALDDCDIACGLKSSSAQMVVSSIVWAIFLISTLIHQR